MHVALNKKSADRMLVAVNNLYVSGCGTSVNKLANTILSGLSVEEMAECVRLVKLGFPEEPKEEKGNRRKHPKNWITEI